MESGNFDKNIFEVEVSLGCLENEGKFFRLPYKSLYKSALRGYGGGALAHACVRFLSAFQSPSISERCRMTTDD